jgi:hypothetical protein
MTTEDPSEYCTIDTCSLELANFTYIPNLGGNVAYLALFSLLLIPQVYLGIRYKTWVCLVLLLSSLTLGRHMNLIKHHRDTSLAWSAVSLSKS